MFLRVLLSTGAIIGLALMYFKFFFSLSFSSPHITIPE
jgi:hypothetical protein